VKVLVLSAPVEPPLYVERAGRLITLGRDSSADVRLPDPTVSGRHATLKKRGDQYLLTDEGSTNGTALAGADGGPPVWLSPGSPRLVREGDRVVLGAVTVELRLEGDALGSPSEDLARDLVTASLAAHGHSIEPEQVESALDELTTLPDEARTPPPAQVADPPPDPAGIVQGGRSRLITDLLVAAAALTLLAVSALGLHLLVQQR